MSLWPWQSSSLACGTSPLERARRLALVFYRGLYLYAAVAACAMVLCVSVIEINMAFNANDERIVHPGFDVVMFIMSRMADTRRAKKKGSVVPGIDDPVVRKFTMPVLRLLPLSKGSDVVDASGGGSTVIGSPYIRQGTEIVPAVPELRTLSVDPDAVGRGLRAHRLLQDDLANLAIGRGLTPLSPGPADANFNLAWIDQNTLTAVEIKSLTVQNEAHQLMYGLGQILEYGHPIATQRGRQARLVLFVDTGQRALIGQNLQARMASNCCGPVVLQNCSHLRSIDRAKVLVSHPDWRRPPQHARAAGRYAVCQRPGKGDLPTCEWVRYPCLRSSYIDVSPADLSPRCRV